MSDDILNELDTWGNEAEESNVRYLRLKKSEKGTKLKDYHLGDLIVLANNEPVGLLPNVNGKTEVVILEINLGRRYQSPYVPGKKRVLFCRSNDRVTPVTDDNRFTPKAADCASCAHGFKAWANYKATKVKPTNPCEENATVAFALADDPSTVFVINFDRDRKVAEELLTSLRAKSKAAITQLNRRPHIFEFIVSLSSITNEKDQWEPSFEFVGLLVEEEVQPFRDLYVARLQRRKKFEGQVRQAEANAAVAQVQQQQIVEQIAPAPAAAPAAAPATPPVAVASRPTYTPPASKRVAGTRPVYTPPAAAVKQPDDVEVGPEPDYDQDIPF